MSYDLVWIHNAKNYVTGETESVSNGSSTGKFSECLGGLNRLFIAKQTEEENQSDAITKIPQVEEDHPLMHLKGDLFYTDQPPLILGAGFQEYLNNKVLLSRNPINKKPSCL